jgi:hypothetical protein
MLETLILGATPAGLQLATTLVLRRRPVLLLATPADVFPPVDPAYVQASELQDGYSLLSPEPGLRFDPGAAADLDAAYRSYLARFAAGLRLEIDAAGPITRIARAADGYDLLGADGRRFQAQQLVLGTLPDPGAWAGEPAIGHTEDGKPAQSAGWESTQAPGLFLVGSLMAQRRGGDPAAELPGSLRYLARSLGHLLTERSDRYAVWPSSAYTNRATQLSATLLERARSAAALQWQAGYLVDVLSRRPGERAARLFREVPAGLVGARYGSRDQTFHLSGIPGRPGRFQLDAALKGHIVARYQGDVAAEDALTALQRFLAAEMRRARS